MKLELRPILEVGVGGREGLGENENLGIRGGRMQSKPSACILVLRLGKCFPFFYEFLRSPALHKTGTEPPKLKRRQTHLCDVLRAWLLTLDWGYYINIKNININYYININIGGFKDEAPRHMVYLIPVRHQLYIYF